MALCQRGIPLFVALQGPRVLAVETEHDRRERSRIENANRIEIACRVFLAMTMVVVSVILLGGLQVH